MRRSIQGRLLLWMISGMAILLTVFAGVVYWVMARSLWEGFDAVLASTARTIAGSIEQGKENITLEIDEHEVPEFFRAVRPDYFQLWREDGKTLSRSPSLQGANLERFEGTLGSPVFRSVRLPDGRLGRAVGLQLVPKIDDEVKEALPQQKVTLVVARETASLKAEIAFLKGLLAITTGGTILLSLLVGTMVVHQGLRPLKDLASHIARIRQPDLSTPIPMGPLPTELVPVVCTLNDLLQRLEEAFHRERSFTSDAAHELRTPLSGIRSTLEVALTRPRQGEDYRQAMLECLDILRQMQKMVDNLLALTRMEAGHTLRQNETLPLNELIQNALRPLTDKARRRGIKIECLIPEELTLSADRSSMSTVFSNLLENSVEYVNDTGTIQISAKGAGNVVELTMVNTGCRLTPEDAQHVFERFWRGDRGRTGTGFHYGLGLALVQRAVISLGGTVNVIVANGTFTVRLILPAVPLP
jgi:signal transduction histidine kinase